MKESSSPRLTVSLGKFAISLQGNGLAKRDAVRELRKPYEVQGDRYKKLREGLPRHHRQGLPFAEFREDVLADVHPTRYPSYVRCLDSYQKRIINQGPVRWFEPPVTDWEHRDLRLVIKPHLGLYLKGKRHILQLWFRDSPMNNHSLQVVMHSLRFFFPEEAKAGTKLGVLDLATGTIYTKPRAMPAAELLVLLRQEADAWLQWADHFEATAP